MPKISVILPVYNAQDYLREAIDSILNQTFIDFEFLIYNDGSIDDTKSIIESYDDKRIIATHSNINKGYVYWLNEGIKRAKSKYIARMDADDISLPERFQMQWDFMESNPNVGACGGQIEIIGSLEKVRKPLDDNEIRWWFFKGNPIAHPSVILRNLIFKEHHFEYNKSLQPAEDFDMWWRLAKESKLANLDTSILLYRIHSQQESTARIGIQRKHHIESLNYFFDSIGLHSEKQNIFFIEKLFSDELDYNFENLKGAILFFNKLENPRAKDFFSIEKIHEKKNEILDIFLERLFFYHPSMLFNLYWKDIKKSLLRKGHSRINFIVKCLIFWKARTI